MRLPNICGLLTASALLIGATSANALTLTIDDLSVAGVEVTINDAIDDATSGNTGNPTANDGIIDFTGQAGNFGVRVATAEGSPERGGPLLLETFLDFRINGGGLDDGMPASPRELSITLIEEQVTLDTSSTNGLANVVSSITILETDTPGVSAETFIQIGVDKFTVGELFRAQTPPTGTDDSERLLSILTGQMFDIVTQITIAHDDKTTDETNGRALVTVAPVPLPAALPLFLTALLGLGFVGRHRRRQAA